VRNLARPCPSGLRYVGDDDLSPIPCEDAQAHEDVVVEGQRTTRR
jgi:hypothetical protein